MAISTLFNQRLSLFVILLALTIAHFTHKHSLFVRGEDADAIIQRTCGETLDPTVCIDCIKSDNSRRANDLPELTHSVIFCTWSQAVYAHDEADAQAQNATDSNMKAALQFCDKTLYSAQITLLNTIITMEAHNYKNTTLGLKLARSDVFNCINVFQQLPAVSVPQKLLDDIVLLRRLDDVALVMMGKLPAN